MTLAAFPIVLPLDTNAPRRIALTPDLGTGADWLEVQILNTAEEVAMRAWLTNVWPDPPLPIIDGAEALSAAALRLYPDADARLTALAGARAYQEGRG